jgi:hypothetical protein
MLGAVGMDMSGDIWSTGAFSFESPLKDLLDSNNFTFEQLLSEDELLQELRGCHQQLFSYFSTEQSVTKLVQYVIQQQQHQQRSQNQVSALDVQPNTDDDDDDDNDNDDKDIAVVQMNGVTTHENKKKEAKPGEWLFRHLQDVQLVSSPSTTTTTTTSEYEKDPLLRQIRFPYMACEIICCEIQSIIDTLVDGKCIFQNNNGNQTNRLQQKQDQDQSVLVDDNLHDDSDPPTPTAYTEIVTSESQGGMVEVVAKSDIETTIVDSKDDVKQISILDLLFSLLYQTPIGQLDDYRAGYFDKILSVLFRKRPEELTTYINSGGIYGRETLIKCMLNHLYSHSIMQIAQRLLLPQRPIGQPLVQPQQQQQHQQHQDEEQDTDQQGELTIGGTASQLNDNNGAEIVAGDDGDDIEIGVRCDWGNSPEVLDLLLDTLIGPSPRIKSQQSNHDGDSDNDMGESQILDLSLNASEVLITIIQNSLLSSTTMLTLTSNDVVQRIVDAATTLPDPEYFSPHESLLTSAMNVLESLVLQLGGYGAVGTMTFLPEESQQQQQDDDIESDNEDIVVQGASNNNISGRIQELESDDTLHTGLEVGIVDKHLISDLGSMLDHLPTLLERLSTLLRHPSTSSWTSPTQFSKSKPIQLLGNSRLRIVRVLESLVLLGDPDVDSILVQSNCLEICLDFFWEFQWCSMLHQSVANLLVHVFEGQNTRVEMQKYFLIKCNLLGRLMDSFGEDCFHHIRGSENLKILIPQESTVSSVFENIHDINKPLDTTSIPSSGESEKGYDTPLHISEDDVDAVMEAQVDGKEDDDGVDLNILEENQAATIAPTTIDLLSTAAVYTESRDVSTVGETHTSPPAQALRCGYMGHVIIICQALVHAYTNNSHEQEMMDGNIMDSEQHGIMNDNVDEDDTKQATSNALTVSEVDNAANTSIYAPTNREDEVMEGPKDIFGDPLLLFEIVNTHRLADKWHDFVDTILAAETAVQSTPLGGLMMQSSGMDMMNSHRPGLADEGYMMGDDGEGPPVPPRGMLGGGDMLHMDENDLDIAASLMAGMNKLGRATVLDGDEDHSNNSADSEKSYDSGQTASEKVGYAFDDPLGKAGGLGIELGKLTQFTHGDGAADVYTGDDDDGSHSSDEEMDTRRSGHDDVPVLDLFAGNFNYEQNSDAEVTPPVEFANFAEFDTTGSQEVGVFANVGDDVFSHGGVNQNEKVTNSDLDDVFGKGDHAELLELDDMPMNMISPIKPINPLTDDFSASESASVNTKNIPDEKSRIVDDLKVDLFDKNLDTSNTDDSIRFEDIQTAPSDELMADSSDVESKDSMIEETEKAMTHCFI